MLKDLRKLPHNVESSLDDSVKELLTLNIDYVGHVIILGESKTGFFSNKKWADLYINKGLSKYDPYANVALSCNIKLFSWDLISVTQEKSMYVVKKREELTGVCNGITSFCYTKNVKEIFAVGTTDKRFDILSILMDKKSLSKLKEIKAQFTENHVKGII